MTRLASTSTAKGGSMKIAMLRALQREEIRFLQLLQLLQLRVKVKLRLSSNRRGGVTKPDEAWTCNG